MNLKLVIPLVVSAYTFTTLYIRKELWKYKLPVAGSASPMTYFYKDYQYIIVNVTGGRFHGFPNKLGDYVFAFRINKNKI